MRIFITADTHHGIRPELERLNVELAEQLLEVASENDAMVVAGDVACGDLRGLASFFRLFENFEGARAFVPGNHDLWSHPERGIGSDVLYDQRLAEVGREHGFHLLDEAPMRLGSGDSRVALAGCYGGFDFGLGDLSQLQAEERERVEEGWRSGMLGRFFWNDYRFTWRRGEGDWEHDVFSRESAARLREHLAELDRDSSVDEVVCVTHTAAHLEEIVGHPAGKRRPMEERVWFRGISGSAALGEAVNTSRKTRLHVCGHTHHERWHSDDDGRQWINIGCDYPRKRWLIYEVGVGARFGSWIE